MLDLNTSAYFNSLTKFIQESVRQSGIDFENEDALKRFVAHVNES